MTISSPESEKEWWAVVFLRVISVTFPSPTEAMSVRSYILCADMPEQASMASERRGASMVRPVIVLIVSFLPCLAREQ